MLNYDFKMLSDYEFELLSRDLLMKELKCNLENFEKGRDQGIDLRYSKNSENTIIVQCKHYANSTYSNLKNSIKNELPKIKKLKPKRYILVTSMGLTPRRKEEIFKLLDNNCKELCDIYDRNSINMLLSKYPEIEQSNYKLWLTSVNVMKKILNNGAYNKNIITIENIKYKFSIYVQNKSYLKAKEMLKNQNVCIISGNPGVGKTTLANMLAVEYIDSGYDLIEITQNISEAYNLLQEGQKQIFIFDDFLGQTGLDIKLNKNEDSDIIKFIEHINKSKNKKFVLTTRGYILNQAQEKYEELARYDFKLNEVTIELEDYSLYDKSRILYNHLYFKKINKEYILNLLDNNIINIIKHSNYNPRLVENITEHFLPKEPNQFYYEFMQNLDNPKRIWEIAYNSHLTYYSQNLVLILATFTYSVRKNKLKMAFNVYNEKKCSKLHLPINFLNFKNALKELDDSFISINESPFILKETENIVIKYNNPSIKDFIENFIIENEDEFHIICESCIFFEQIKNLCDIYLKIENDINEDILIESIIRILDKEEKDNGLKDLIDKLILINEFNYKKVKNAKLNEYILDKIDIILSNEEFDYLITIDNIKSIMEILKCNNLLYEKQGYIIEILNKKIEEEIYYIEEFRALKLIEEEFEISFNSDSKENINYMFKEYIEGEKERVIRDKNNWEIESLIDDSNELSSYFEYDNYYVVQELEDTREEMNKEDEIQEKENFTLLESDMSDGEIVDMFMRLTE